LTRLALRILEEGWSGASGTEQATHPISEPRPRIPTSRI